ncbi:MAG: aromatic ring-hydroxylating dioxygenase subunit alpha [Bacteriovoracaceae bacterium]|nr:aromatic ring-hydroxylating dioxygenase subunit alpha [Bacteriovoracaceae bacterium]
MESLKERDGKIVENWYIACLSEELKNNQVVQRVVYEKPLAIFRTQSGAVSIVADRCLHRLALLSEGEVRGERLVCMYHGWEYDLDGEVKRIPAENPEQKNAPHCQKKIYSCEQDGAIWVWMGEGKPSTETPPWRFPFAQDEKWEHYFMITDFPNEVTNLAENFMDVPHTVYVHQGWFRDEKSERKKVPHTVETKNGRVLVTYLQEKDEFSWGAKLLLNPSGAPMKHTDEYIYPNITRVDYWFGENGFIINSQGTPVGALKSRVYTYIAYKIPYFKKILKPIFGFYTRQVIEQDVEIMHNQGSSLQNDPVLNFRSTPSDELHVQIERLRFYGKTGNPLLETFEIKKEIDFWI